MVTIRERLVSFGKDGKLFGVVSLPAGEERRQPVVIPNAGIVHRVGPHRMHVRIARRLAQQGHTVLRFDLHGLGDSGVASSALGHEEQAVEDIRAALDQLEAESAALVGLCSGADNGMNAALEDERLGQLVLLDPHAYGSRRAKLDVLMNKAADPDRWLRAAGRIFASQDIKEIEAVEGPEDDPDNDRIAPPREVFGDYLSTLTGRGTDILMRYSDFVTDTLQTPQHFFGAFPEFDFRDRIDVDVDLDTDHTYSSMAAQARLQDRIADWLARHPGPASSS